MLLVRKAIKGDISANELAHLKGVSHSCHTQSDISANKFENVTSVRMNWLILWGFCTPVALQAT
jgi:hypothetical protein